MFRVLSRFALLFLLVFPVVPLLDNKGLCNAEEDAVEDEDTVQDAEDEGEVEDEDDEGVVEDEDTGSQSFPSATDEDEVEPITAHKEAETAIIFSTGSEPAMVAGKEVSGFIHFSNTGSNNFVITSIEGSFRYPQDFSYVIQNFTVSSPNKMVDAGKQGSFRYDLTPGELAGGRSFGLLINVNYKDTEDNIYRDAVYNQTIQVQENEEGVDTETFFMYMMLIALVALTMLGLYQLAANKTKRGKRTAASHTTNTNGSGFETGTNNGPVDYNWIPEETLKLMQKSSPKVSPRRSPRKRVTKKAAESE